ncbi:hypothetical protein DRO55_01065 [Candidatus Bathyarchaeota archaeon]|nr:MAG: hypothetical protein DRO55_01065 [Candidatus Bathyarchaeota archaeon]
MRFLVDGMLGKLTRWLRMLGYDVEYHNALNDEELIAIAGREGRILLTRDLDLYQKAKNRGLNALLIKGRNEAEKLAELAKTLKIRLEIDTAISRCPKCNSKIRPIKKEEIIDRIPESTSRFYDEFWICTKCGQIYWHGSHWRRINETLKLARKLAGEGVESRKTGESSG